MVRPNLLPYLSSLSKLKTEIWNIQKRLGECKQRRENGYLIVFSFKLCTQYNGYISVHLNINVHKSMPTRL